MKTHSHKTKKYCTTVKWEDFIVEQFKKDKEFAQLAVKSELEEFQKTGDARYLLTTLNQYAKAFGFTNLEHETGISRQALYSILNGKSIPRLDTMWLILKALGYTFSFRKIRPIRQIKKSAK